ncbi:MAG: histone deacetylase [bacterium]
MKHLSIFYDDICTEHENGPHHPERPERLQAVRRAIDGFQWPEALQERRPEDAPTEALTRVHDPRYVEQIASTAGRERSAFDMDTAAGPRSYAAALRAAGGAIAMVDRALAGDGVVPFAAVRPPGHHAERNQAMGFCFFNNIAVAAAHARHHHGLSRVAVIDWDVHHGNGTQHIFEADQTVLYLSVHEFPLFPGTGRLREVGRDTGEGYTVNVPLPGGQYDAQYVRVFREIFEPVITAYRPELILVSAGFDAHGDDPLANMALSADGFALLTRIVREWADAVCGGRLGFLLEGGYNLSALTASVQRVMEALIDQFALHEDDAYGASLTRADRTIEQVKAVQRSYWPGMEGG